MSNATLEQIAKSLQDYITAMNDLKNHGVLNNKKDFTAQIGERLVLSAPQNPDNLKVEKKR